MCREQPGVSTTQYSVQYLQSCLSYSLSYYFRSDVAIITLIILRLVQELYVQISVADTVHFFRIRIRICGLGFKNPDLIQVTQERPDLTGFGSGFYLDMCLMFSKINIFHGLFYNKSKHGI